MISRMIPLADRHDLDYVRYLNVSQSLCKELDRKGDSLLAITLLLLHAFIIQPTQPKSVRSGVDNYFLGTILGIDVRDG
jgi:hypothetical protein